MLGAWRNNMMRAPTVADPTQIVISGGKVNSSMLNLLGFMNEVNNDTWVANYSFVSHDLFRVNSSKPLPGKGAGYMAMNVATRQPTQRMGWQPAEVQETVWSWTKALFEKADSRAETPQRWAKSWTRRIITL